MIHHRPHSVQFPHVVVKKMNGAGLPGVTIPEKDGGGLGTINNLPITAGKVIGDDRNRDDDYTNHRHKAANTGR